MNDGHLIRSGSLFQNSHFRHSFPKNFLLHPTRQQHLLSAPICTSLGAGKAYLFKSVIGLHFSPVALKPHIPPFVTLQYSRSRHLPSKENVIAKMNGLKKVVPLILLLVFVAIVAFVGFVVWSVVLDVKKNTRAEMERKHVSVSRKGMTVSMKELNDESYKDRTQRYVVSTSSLDATNCGVWSSFHYLPAVFWPHTSLDVEFANFHITVCSSTCGTTPPFRHTRVDFGI